MARRKGFSPTLNVTLTQANWTRAIRSNSGGCLVADAIKDQYPNLTKITVDMATIRATDRHEGVRYTYLTPPAAQHALLSFDQGWDANVEQVTIKHAIAITRVIDDRGENHRSVKQREERLADLEAKVARGEKLTAREKASLSRITNPKAKTARPSAYGPRTVEIRPNRGGVVVVGGPPLPTGPSHPNLLRGRNRHFGAKLADAGLAFEKAVESEVSLRLRAREADAS